MQTARSLLLALLLVGSAGRAAAQEVGPVISALQVEGQAERVTRRATVTIVGAGLRSGGSSAEPTLTLDGQAVKLLAARDDQVSFVVPDDAGPGPLRLRLAVAGRGEAEATLVVRVGRLVGCIDGVFCQSWTGDPDLPTDPRDPTVEAAVRATFKITRFERSSRPGFFEAEGTCGEVPDGWPLLLELRRDRELVATYDVQAHLGRWRAEVGPHAAPGSYQLDASFDLGAQLRPEARDFRLSQPAARQGLYDFLGDSATLRP